MTEITIRGSQSEIDDLVKRIRTAIPELPKQPQVSEVRMTLNGLEIIRIFVLKQ